MRYYMMRFNMKIINIPRFRALKYVMGALAALLSTACQEEIIIDTEEGEAMIGIYGGITTDLKEHRITISRTASFYSKSDIEMISGAEVEVVDQNTQEVFPLREKSEGEYFTEPMAGVVGHTYQLKATIADKGELLHFQSQSQIDSFPNPMDSLQVHVYTLFDVVDYNYFKVCPYFQTSKRNIYYLFDLEINGMAYSDTLSKKARLHLGQMSGLYYNGIEMSLIYKDLNVYPHGLFYLDQTISTQALEVGDTLRITTYSIPKGYYNYIGDISNSMGSNPLMGSPTNVRTNIVGKEKEAVGYFYAASCTHFEQIIQSVPSRE